MTYVLRVPSHRFRRFYGNPQKWFMLVLPGRRESANVWEPKISVSRQDGRLKYTVEVDGTKPEDLDVSVSEGIITIKGERRQELEVDRREYGWRETSHSSFRRTLTLPYSADWEKAEASYEDGVLEISMGISDEGPKRIEIQAARQ